MPQLIAMIIIVVGAMIYMFQTFGGTGDKITGVAQKTSVITEIQNIKTGLQFAARDGVIYEDEDEDEDEFNSLKGLASKDYFAEQVNNQLKNMDTGYAQPASVKTDNNAYNAISFGGNTKEKGGMVLALVTKEGKTPGIFVDLSFDGSSLKDTAGFLESQIANDLKGIAYIDRGAETDEAGGEDFSADEIQQYGKTALDKLPGKTTDGTDTDGKFTIYFLDFASSEVVK
ncbi:hypothetical protein Q6A86_05205 [Aliarcobacter skirrowii]|uniref:hypothetical protein n=1 Tax=Aliarcobacter skirrowii TaxID=28200 RepID=UPI0029BF991B|nr:hypothetical protein [Aliarcobacter skirrowii]MDX4012384.1 hypothetical protein [Aliarcobacter skirrowii]